MPKRAKELKPIEVGRLTHKVSADGKAYNALHPVGGVPGLVLQVTPSGAKSWILRVMVGTKRRSIGLGSYPTVGLSEAREKAREKRRLIEQGIDPVEEKRVARERLETAQARHITFDAAVDEYFKRKQKEFRSATHRRDWENSVARYASPVIGKKPVDEITAADIEELLTRDDFWERKTSTASKLRGRIERVLDWCIAGEHRAEPNPARWRANLDARLSDPSKIAKASHHAALAIDRMPEFMAHLRRLDIYGARALQFLVLTAARSNEVRGSTWSEIDLEKRLWTVPPERSKTGKEHRVPLAPDAVALLKELPREYGTDLVFPSIRRGKMSQNVFRDCIIRMNEAMPEGEQYLDPNSGRIITAHGMRSVFRDWTAEHTSTPHHVAEMALAHVIPSMTESAYRRGDLLEKRRRLMESWARFCKEGFAPAGVTPIRAQEG